MSNSPEEPVDVYIKKLSPDAKMPTKGTSGAACWDVYSNGNYLVPIGGVVGIGTGLAFELPEGYELEVRPRSGLSKDIQITNSPGTLDSDYRGELFILMIARIQDVKVRKGDRIAQVKVNRVIPTNFIEAGELSETRRGENGFGSTGR